MVRMERTVKNYVFMCCIILYGLGVVIFLIGSHYYQDLYEFVPIENYTCIDYEQAGKVECRLKRNYFNKYTLDEIQTIYNIRCIDR